MELHIYFVLHLLGNIILLLGFIRYIQNNHIAITSSCIQDIGQVHIFSNCCNSLIYLIQKRTYQFLLLFLDFLLQLRLIFLKVRSKLSQSLFFFFLGIIIYNRFLLLIFGILLFIILNL